MIASFNTLIGQEMSSSGGRSDPDPVSGGDRGRRA